MAKLLCKYNISLFGLQYGFSFYPTIPGDNLCGVYYTKKLSTTESSDFFVGFVVDDYNIGLLNKQFIGGHHIVKTATAFGKYL